MPAGAFCRTAGLIRAVEPDETFVMVARSREGRRVRLTHQLLGALTVLVGIGGMPGCSNDNCRVPVDQVGCKATFDEHVQYGLSIGPSACAFAGPCGVHLVWQSTPNLGSLTCIYNESGQHLMSATSCSDVTLACGANCIRGGQSINVQNECNVSALPRTCASGDAGQD